MMVVENDALAAATIEYASLAFCPSNSIYLGLGLGVGGGLIFKWARLSE
jgi:predicted NBD/HSP70 family sugar kinase